MRDPELVARAQRAAARLESSWEHWRALHGLAVAPGQPVVSYVGYSLTEPWGEPRVVVGIGADEAEFLADYLDRDDCAVAVQLPVQQSLVPEQPQPPENEYSSASLLGAPVALGTGRPQSDVGAGWPQGEVSPSWHGDAGPGWPQGDAGPGWPQGDGGPSWPQAAGGDITAEFAAWSSGELPGQASEQLANWPGGPDEPAAGA
jgi:hypothetical protein